MHGSTAGKRWTLTSTFDARTRRWCNLSYRDQLFLRNNWYPISCNITNITSRNRTTSKPFRKNNSWPHAKQSSPTSTISSILIAFFFRRFYLSPFMSFCLFIHQIKISHIFLMIISNCFYDFTIIYHYIPFNSLFLGGY